MEKPGDPVDPSQIILHERAASGVRWIAFGRLTAQLLGLGYTAVLARVLGPREYGLFAMAMIIVQVARYVEGLRLESALVQARDVSRNQLSSAYVFLVGLGLLFCAAFWLGAPLGRLVYNEDEVVPLIRGLSLIFVLSSVSSVPRAILNRRLDFKGIGLIQAVQVLPSGAIGVFMALNGYGVWSLIGYSLAQYAVEAGACLVRARWIPTLRWRWSDLRNLFSYGRVATANELLAYLQFNLPAALIGRFAGSSPLGFFQLANAVVAKPASVLQEVVRRVSFPVFSASPRLSEGHPPDFGNALRATLAVSLPAAAGIAIYAEELVSLLYGPGWGPAVPLVRTLAGLTILLPWMSLISSLIQAAGRPGVDARMRAVILAGLLLSLPLALQTGVNAVCLAIVIWFSLFVILGQTWVNRHVSCTWSGIIRSAASSLASTAIMWLILTTLGYFAGGLPASIRLLLGLASGTCVYAACIAVLDRSLIHLALTVFRRTSNTTTIGETDFDA